MRQTEAADQIAAYLSAYVRAHGEAAPFRVLYEKGWVEFRSRNSSFVSSRRRLSSLAEMTARLEAVSAPPALNGRGI